MLYTYIHIRREKERCLYVLYTYIHIMREKKLGGGGERTAFVCTVGVNGISHAYVEEDRRGKGENAMYKHKNRQTRLTNCIPMIAPTVKANRCNKHTELLFSKYTQKSA